MTDVAHEPLDAAEGGQQEPPTRAPDNPLVRAVERITLPLRAKLLIGFGVVGVLLALAIVLGLVALNQSNSRGEQLRRLQQRAVYVQGVLTDAGQLQKAIDLRINAPGSMTTFGSPLDLTIANEWDQLCYDAGATGCLRNDTGPFRLSAVDPAASEKIIHSKGVFYVVSGNAALPLGPTPAVAVQKYLRRANRFATSLTADLEQLAGETRARTDALVAANHSSFASSRNLLIGIGAGSLLLALALALVLSSSVVGPLRRTGERLAEIGAGDFSGELEVANRDEIGTLAADVNRMSDELQRVYAELETASRHKSDFLATMSHELRTPLNAIIGFSEVLHEQMFGELNDRQLAYVGDVLEAGKHLLSLINDVLDLAKIEAGKMELELSQVAVPDLLRGAVSMHSERASRGGIELSLIAEPEEITITADERRVRQIVFNLLSNAVKFTPADGRIDVSARQEDGQIEIAVADTGPGIAADDLQAIFEEFEQAGEGRQAEGTGLGLPLSRKLVELHGGRLWAESAPGRGSTFRFTLPITQEVS